ncbi:MAG TPA: ATP-binding protein [Actinomycetota bacterium]|nr:ATP-binding protein [Actinomycetota bacterium]
MLGRQQIAGIPTAISELFKNAHDAYADEAVVDFFRSDRLFVLRDDGLGMTEDDFESRWLTLGTESKAGSTTDLPPLAKRPGYRTRPVLGEKGIGRLAIGAIGPQVLMLSRPLREGQLGDLLVSFVHWGMFELPAANLEEIEVPTVTIPGGTLPSANDVSTLVGWVSDNLRSIARPTDRTLTKRIRDELAGFRGFAPDALSDVLGAPSLLDGPGTHFFIRPASELLAAELDEGDREATPLRRLLVGFANTMTPDHPPPLLRTSFRDHYTEDAWEDVIDEGDFFTPEEFEAADHHIRGTFDEFGQFKGTVGVYASDPVDYAVAWPRARGSRARCGPFALNLAYVQGNLRDSRLDPELFNEISKKLSRYGGLYIYRDGIRVLPYGNTDFDFLDIEVRRAKSAGDAFFSYRRMFGVIELTRRDNSSLREKAGREGFADNEAYRQFREILMHFLYQVALDFFREKGSMSERFWSQRAELERLDLARHRRNRQVRVRRRELGEELDSFFRRVEEARPQEDVAKVVERLAGRLATALAKQDANQAAEEVVSAESEARTALHTLTQSYAVARPRGIGLTRTQRRTWAAYENERARLVEQVFDPGERTIEETLAQAVKEHDISIDRRLRFDAAVSSAAERARALTRSAHRDLENVSKDVRSRAQALGRNAVAEVDDTIQRVLSKSASTDVASLTNRAFVQARTRLESELADAARVWQEALAAMVDQFAGISFPNGNPASAKLDEVEALETDLEALRERAEEDLELIQIGTAIEIINHEFEGTVKAIRRSLRRIKGWADANPALREPYRDLRASFEHLDGYLRLFTPFHRRLYRTPVEIVGAEIDKFLRSVFEKKLESAEIHLVATPRFLEHRLVQFPSVIYPVFVNLVDNAIHWLTDYRGERTITLDARKDRLIIRDSGPGVPAVDYDAVFEFGFSRKPGGTGYGLFISREVLSREGWNLKLSPQRPDRGAEFIISEGRKTNGRRT